jgi:DnaK suppressor protein
MYKSIIKKLEKMKKEILSEMRQNVDLIRDDLQPEIGDSYDSASKERDRELNLLLMGREKEKLNMIDEALTRIEEGTYGICEECGEAIPLKRLLALPFTQLCIECKNEMEKLDKTVKNDKRDKWGN